MSAHAKAMTVAGLRSAPKGCAPGREIVLEGIARSEVRCRRGRHEMHVYFYVADPEQGDRDRTGAVLCRMEGGDVPVVVDGSMVRVSGILRRSDSAGLYVEARSVGKPE